MRIFHFGAALVASVVASSAVGWRIGWQAPPPGWHGKVAKIVRGGGGAELRGRGSLAEGAAIESGADIATDRKQRARLEMSDGSVLVLDRDTEIELDPSPATRIVHVKHGVVALDVAHVVGAWPAKIVTDRGEVLDGSAAGGTSQATTVAGTELTVTATDDTTDVEVRRGAVRAKAGGGRELEVAAGQEALLTASGVEVGPSAGRGAGDLLGEKNQEAEDAPGAVGELRARRPGQTDENDRSLRIASHAVKIRVAGAMARTEVEETFANDTNDDLEGIYRFPVPAGAQVDRLALDQDGKLVDGAFVEKSRAEKILKGAIAQATPVRRFHDDIVWVPGPWRDPALLEWKQGGRFELRIFPIPKHGTRRIVLGYTQTVDASLGMRRYVYPLPSAGGVKMDDFSIDAQVLGADPAVGVHARGYDLSRSGDRLAFREASFSPTGDLTLEYALPNRKSELSAWAFDAGGDRFVAMALRPHLPASAEARPRDWAVVVDSGRSMFGERFARAARVAVALAQTLDRRDRVTVLACDVACRRNTAGFVPAGASGAKAVADFLTPVVPDGASDLVAAVRNGAALGEPGRELRVVLVSDGVATAGYERPARAAEEVRDAVPKDAAVLAVPVGSDANGDWLGEVALGGGGVVVPYAPGERVSDVVLAIAGAGAGEMLRDPAIELPAGLDDVAPRALPTLRAGGETYVVAKMQGSRVQGQVVLRGQVGGEPFETRYPLDVSATTDAGNAFVPRLFAGLRVRDLERDGGEAARAEAVSLSQKLAVPSRFTSLLVLESDAMFRAFGIDRAQSAPKWTGETLGDSSDVTVNAEPEADEAAVGNTRALLAPAHHVSGGGGGTGGFGLGHGSLESLAGPAATASPSAPAQAANAEKDKQPDDALALRRDAWWRRRPGRFMRRVFHREATLTANASFVEGADRVSSARLALAASPDDRGKHRDLARALLRRGSFDELEQVLGDWQKRDPLDADAIALRAELLASRGDRASAARVLSGVAASSDPARLDQLASGASMAGQNELACALRVASAESSPEDATRVARAVRCEREHGRTRSADRWLDEAGARRGAVEAALAAFERPSAVSGDIVVDASWSGGADLNLAVIDPSGQRLGWLAGRGRAEDTTSRTHEKLAVSSGSVGSFLVEIARSDKSNELASGATGFIQVSAFGMTKRVPFALAGPSARVARIDARWVSELVPIDDLPNVGAAASLRPFDVTAAHGAVSAVSLVGCSSATTDGVFGAGSADVLFSPSSGTVSRVEVASPFAASRAGACVRARLFSARVSPFSGSPGRVTRTFVIAP